MPFIKIAKTRKRNFVAEPTECRTVPSRKLREKEKEEAI